MVMTAEMRFERIRMFVLRRCNKKRPGVFSQTQEAYHSTEEGKIEKHKAKNDEMCFDIWKHI